MNVSYDIVGTIRAQEHGHQPIVFESHSQDARYTQQGNTSPACTAQWGTGGNNMPLVAEKKAFAMQRIGEYKESEQASTMKSRDYKDATDLIAEKETKNLQWIVRRLTPVECERLQGFPDGWTDIGEWFDENGKKHKPADSPRYKALGNSIALPQWYWIFQKMKPYIGGNPTLGSLFDGIGGFPLVFESMRSHETKRLCTKGLARIVNPMICALVEANSFNIKGDPTINDVQFYIVPMMNALIRVGSSEQKKRMFRAMVGEEQTFQYTPTRGKNAGVTIDETLAQHVARECSSCKYQQNKTKDKAVAELQELIEKHGADQNKILFCNSTGILDNTLTGVVAIKLAEMYAKPCVLLRTFADEPDYYGGSMRNPDGSPIESLKQFLMSTGDFESVLGHDNAAGVKIKKENVPKAIADCNELLKDVTMSKAIVVDFDFDYSKLTVTLPKTMYEMHKIWAQGISEPYFYIRNIPLAHSGCAPMGKNGNMWKYSDEEKGIDFVCFNDNGRLIDWIEDSFEDDEVVTFYGDNYAKIINAVCRLSLNQYGNKVTPQAQIVDFEVI